MEGQGRIVEAVALGHGQTPSLSGDIRRLFMRFWAWTLLRRWIPLDLRQRALFGSFKFVRWFSDTMTGRTLIFIGGGSKGNTFENDLMKLIFQATAIANIADNAASSPLTNIQYSLHTADPGEAGDQTTSEISYTGYARIAVARTSGGHTVTNNSVSPVANIDFGQMTAGAGGTVTHFIAGTANSGTGKILYSGTVTPNIVVSNGVTPRLTTASAITED